MNKDIDLLIKKIEEESKLIKGDASKNEMQEILKEKLVIERERDNLLLENKQLKDKIESYERDIVALQQSLKGILDILQGEDKIVHETDANRNSGSGNHYAASINLTTVKSWEGAVCELVQRIEQDVSTWR